MKLIRFEIGDLGKDELGNDKTFKSLHSGFSVDFHQLTAKGTESMNSFQPFCFAGLNGSGKSNVLEALAAIFYHLEMCVAKYRPESFDKIFKKEECSPDAFCLEYLICRDTVDFAKEYDIEHAQLVTIVKVVGGAPEMYVQANPLLKPKNEEITRVSLQPPKGDGLKSPGKSYLPDLVIGYSSGENEILSLPFIKNRLIHFDEYKEAVRENYDYKEPETSLVYIDPEMSQAVLLSCLLFENDETLNPLKEELKIVGIQSFRMNLNLQMLEFNINDSKPILKQLEPTIDKLKLLSSSWYESKLNIDQLHENECSVLSLDFCVDQKTKDGFRDHFNNSSFELFRFFQILYELNANIVSDHTKAEVYDSQGYYTDGKLPVAAPEDKVFYFLDYMILKDIKGSEKPKELLLREFSDGEHQFLHTIGICLMLKNRRTLLLLDEPETHFNPSWRAKFIKVLNDSLEAGGSNNFLKDVILSSHSPFIISDCLPNNVIFFKKNKETFKVEATSAKNLGIRTFGTSVEYILDELFEYNQSIGDWANRKLERIDFENVKNEADVLKIKNDLSALGVSIEKDMVLVKLNQISNS